MKNIKDIYVVECIYQLKVSKLIRERNYEKKELVTEVKKLIERKEELIKNM